MDYLDRGDLEELVGKDIVVRIAELSEDSDMSYTSYTGRLNNNGLGNYDFIFDLGGLVCVIKDIYPVVEEEVDFFDFPRLKRVGGEFQACGDQGCLIVLNQEENREAISIFRDFLGRDLH